MAVSVEKMIQDLEAITEMTRADRVFTFVSLCNHEMLMNALKKQAVMQKLDMSVPDDVYSFVYGVLKIHSPHLFMERG